MQAVGLQTHIWNNNLRSILLLAGFPLLLIALVYVIGLLLIGAGLLPSTGTIEGDMAYGLDLLAVSAPLAIVVSLAWFAIAYFANTKLISLATGAKAVSREQEPELYNLLENLAISRGMRTPRLQVIESQAMNAFASGLNEKQYTITVTRGLKDALTTAELEAVLAHELTHVINRDVRTMVIAAVFAGIITLLSQIIFRSVLWGRVGRRGGGRGGGRGAIVFVLLAMLVAAIGYVLAIVIRLALSRRREFVADAGAVELTKNPDAMISALRKISGGAKLEAPDQVRAMFLENHEASAFGGLFATHPPISRRIDALVRFAGGRETPQGEPAAGPWG